MGRGLCQYELCAFGVFIYKASVAVDSAAIWAFDMHGFAVTAPGAESYVVIGFHW
jgi:hypothetical protein